MSNLAPQPSSLAEWKAYATSEEVTSIPLREAENVNEDSVSEIFLQSFSYFELTLIYWKKIAILRGVYLEASAALLPSLLRLNVFSDVLAFTEQETIISPYKNGIIQIMCRVLTADAPVNIVIPSDASGAISIYAAIVDQPITVATGDDKLTLDLGPESENVGVALGFSKGKLDYEYEKKYPTSRSDDLKASLNTLLRIALVQFWKNTSIAISLCSYVATMTTNKEDYNLLNTQAVALGQQLAGQAMAGPSMSYAPVLVLNRYKETTQNALNAATAFELQFERFQDKRESLENQILAWDTMLSQAKNESNMRINIRNMALEKYKSSRITAKSCETQFEEYNFDLEMRRIQFENGFAKWQDEQQLKAVFQILMAAACKSSQIALPFPLRGD